MISVVIPTYNERDNISWIIEQVGGALAEREHEIIVVDDDSPDGTAEEVGIIASDDGVNNLKVVKRVGERGLGSAVVRGFNEAAGDVIAVMDADGSHPAEALLRMHVKIKEGYDVVFASRHIKGGGIKDWTVFRKGVSKAAADMAYGLTKSTDPMSGFFMFKREVIEGVELNPKGFKIGLEILVKCDHKKYGEVPYVFRNRLAGESKLGGREYLDYLRHLLSLHAFKLKR